MWKHPTPALPADVFDKWTCELEPNKVHVHLTWKYLVWCPEKVGETLAATAVGSTMQWCLKSANTASPTNTFSSTAYICTNQCIPTSTITTAAIASNGDTQPTSTAHITHD